MKTIKQDQVMTSSMLSKEAWKELNKFLKDNNINKYSDEMSLADGLVKFIDLWQETNNLFINMYDPIETKNGYEIFVDFDNSERYKYKGNLERDLTTRWADVLLYD